ncbi:unnamed protein product [Paramecium sonneborni]|uniref:Uncharacterized protein n=1 Tax=Paramecium sonneborni TaxID=65129 RepID=A0A8S1M3A9_9CILI|nr:unnamed protein product [Paramecium sonneborni]
MLNENECCCKYIHCNKSNCNEQSEFKIGNFRFWNELFIELNFSEAKKIIVKQYNNLEQNIEVQNNRIMSMQ